jgi:predicted dehydrogenase
MAGEIGDVLEISVEHGRGPLLWSHPHSTDLILWLAASTDVDTAWAVLEPHSVNWVNETSMDSDPVVEAAFFRFQNGITSHILRSGGLTVRVVGTNGSVAVHADGSFVEINRPPAGTTSYFLRREVEYPLLAQSPTTTAITELAKSICDDEAMPIQPLEIDVGIRMLMACAWSHLRGSQVVKLAELPPHLCVSGRSEAGYA